MKKIFYIIGIFLSTSILYFVGAFLYHLAVKFSEPIHLINFSNIIESAIISGIGGTTVFYLFYEQIKMGFKAQGE
jgi:hypothetical protein